MKKSRIEKLIPIADEAIKNSGIVNDGKVNESYDGKIAGFGVSVAISGLKPTLAMYFPEDKKAINTRLILEAIAKIIVEDNEYKSLTETTAKGLLEDALGIISEKQKKELKKYVLEAAIALKLVVRTYEQVKKEES